MDVTIMGTGNMARGMATRVLAGGHGVTLRGHEAGKAEQLAGELGGSVGTCTVGDPIEGEVVVLAVPYEAAAPLVQRYVEQLSGKVVADITNPVDWQTFDGLVTPPDSSAAEEIQKAASEGAQGDGGALVRDGGLVAKDAGPLRRARQLEGLGFLGMTLQQPLGLNFQSAWKLIS